MKAYVCDICGDIIEKPYDARMREFYIGAEFDHGMTFFRPTKKTTRIH